MVAEDYQTTPGVGQDESYYDGVALVGYIHLDADVDARLHWQQLQVQLARLEAASKEAEKQADEVLKASDPGAVVDAGAVERVLTRFKSVRERLADLKDEELTKDELAALRRVIRKAKGRRS